MMSRIALPLLGLLVATGCTGRDASSALSPQMRTVTEQGAALASLFPRSGDLHVTKECSQYTRLAGGFCTITSSNLEEIEAGAKVIYAEAAAEGTLDTDVVLDAGSGNTANGHVVLDLAANKGTATLSGGTGKFVGFEAQADVTADSDGVWHWSGTYSFD